MVAPKTPANPAPIRWVRVLRLSLFAIVLLLLATLAGPSYLYARSFAYIGCVGPRDSLETLGYPSEAITFPSRLGYTLRGWYSPGAAHPEIAIVLLPGVSGNTFASLPDAATLAEAGYSTLIYEHRSCADPNLIHSGGYWESFDLRGAVDYLKARPGVEHVAVFGFSTGGSTAIIAAGQDADIEAVIAEGAFSSLADSTLDPRGINTPLDWLARHTVLIFDELLGVPVDKVAPIDYVARISPRPILLIYGELEEADQHGIMVYEAAGQPKELWIVPGSVHGGYRAADPVEYERRIVTFFDNAFDIQR